MCSVTDHIQMINNLLLCYQNNENICTYVQLELESNEEFAHDISDLLTDACDNKLYIHSLYRSHNISVICTLISPQNQNSREIKTSCSFSKNTITKDEEWASGCPTQEEFLTERLRSSSASQSNCTENMDFLREQHHHNNFGRWNRTYMDNYLCFLLDGQLLHVRQL